MSEENWKLERDLCRCCLSEGSFKNLAEPCLYEGQEEIYSEMLLEHLSVNLTPVSGPLCTSTYTICEECILRLRDACGFKRQVLLSEKRFRDLYARDVIQMQTSSIGVKKEVPDSDHEANEDDVKVEYRLDDDDDFRLDYDDDDNKSDLELDLQSAKKAKTKKPKAKDKPKPKKRAGRPRKKEAETAAGEAEPPKEKKGVDEKQNVKHYTIVEQDGTNRYMCNVCQRQYMRQDLFSQHYKHVHLKLRPKLRACYFCDVKVPGHMRTRHLEEAHGIPRPECNACGKKFAFPFQVISHQKRFHMDEKLFPCPSCDMKFTIPSKLAQHSVKHSSIRPHKCDYCEKAFRWKKNLTTHIMMHLNDRRHVCSVCSEAFVQQTSLKYHLSRKHPELI